MVFWRWKTKTKEKESTPENCEDVQATVDEEVEEGTTQEMKEEVSPELLEKQQLIEVQRRREENAKRRGVYCENQRVRYFYKAMNEWYDAMIVGVHYDDGPDKPYYTIVYVRIDVEVDEEGNESVVDRKVEKQTTPDRLQCVDFDADKTWELLSKTKK